MEFDPIKENIQPLRGGRNATQLGVAVQAENNEEYQRELLHQREELENSIRHYTGEDPLDNWYHFISWVEQSYPKHGHEGNLVSLLEECLNKFENDKRYKDDRRFCKLWIKYIDLLQNPLEMYQMMHARGLCSGCADFYKAWAYYHEAAGDYKNADLVFECGKNALAQPYEELAVAHHNMMLAAGEHFIKGLNENRLLEKRQALTSLRTYRPGKVGNVRSVAAMNPGILPSETRTRNAAVPVYDDRGEVHQGLAAGPVSILGAARRQEVSKENMLKPGTWTTVPHKRHNSANVHRTPSFTVHEDDSDITSKGIQLPHSFFAVTLENLSGFKPQICYATAEDPSVVPMYPKAQVYCDPGTEYSIEEIKAKRYKSKSVGSRLNVPHVETQQAVQSILEDSSVMSCPIREGKSGFEQSNFYQTGMAQPVQVNMNVSNDGNLSMQQIQNREVCKVFRQSQEQRNQQELLYHSLHQNDGLQPNASQQPALAFHIYQSPTHSSFQQPPQAFNSPNEEFAPGDQLESLWRSTEQDESSNSFMMAARANVTKFSLYEESSAGAQPQIQPKGSSMKTPFKVLSADDLAETGSRGGLDVAAAAQPVDSAKRLAVFEDDSSSSFGELPGPANLNDSCNTQMFNFNLNAMKVSTPEKPVGSPKIAKDAGKQLFAAGPGLSTIFEETKSYGSSVGSSQKSGLNQSRPTALVAISEEHNSYLAQNLMANAALRSTLGDLMDCDSHQSSPVIESVPLVPDPEPVLLSIVPLEQAPSDPFRPSLITMLLEKVSFPGRHSYGYQSIAAYPRLMVKKEPIRIGNDRYLIDKQLGKGTFGTVYRAVNEMNRTVALKYQRPPNKWEFYICRELQARVSKHPLRERFMDIHIGYYHEQGSVLVSDYSPCGSLLDVRNAVKQKSGRSMKESLCIYFCIDMLKIVSAMHGAQIIHADVKPDNFLVQLAPDGSVVLQLIDFGCSIDMALFPEGTMFTRRVTTEDFICCEMRDGRPWSYHTDLFCVAATAHTLLFDKYIQVQKKDGHWSITQRLSRYMRLDLWNMFFSSLLNQQNGPADCDSLQSMLSDALCTETDFQGDLRFLVNLLNNR